MDIAKRRTEISTAIARVKLVRDLVGGTPAMQDGKWIKQGSAEDLADYENRVAGSVLFNGYKRTRGYLTGQVFKKDMEVVNEDSGLKELFQRMEYDIDLQGNDIRTFSQMFFEEGLDDGAAFILVQYPTVRMNEAGQFFDEASGEWRTRTRQTDQDNGWRPYFIRLRYDQILGWRYEYRNGVKVLTQLRIMEHIVEPGVLDVEDQVIEQVRLLERGRWSTWRKASEEKDEWYMVDEGETSIPDIPLAVFMPGEGLTDLTAIPALEDLAYLNLRHFVATADQHVLMAYVRRPPWFGRALVQDGEQVVFGPGRMVHSTSSEAALESVGIDPASVEAGRGELKDLEERMSLYGLQMLTPSLRATGPKTATQASQESAESVSQLQDWAQGLKDCFDQAFKFAAMYEGIEVGEEPEVKINTEFQPGFGLEPQTLILAVERGILPKSVAFDEFRRRGLISDSWEWEDVQALLDREQVASTGIQPGGTALGLLQSAASQTRQPS